MPGGARRNSVGISFENLSYRTKCGLKRETKEILHGLSGDLPGGRLIAILGPSGSGKTTLLNILAGRVTPDRGSVRTIRSQDPINSSAFNCNRHEDLPNEAPCDKAVVIHVPQEAHLCGLLTVRETFQIAAALKLPHAEQFAAKEVHGRIESVTAALGLTKVRDSRVSVASGGERKRLALGVELLGDFDVLLLDEPTTGLDSASTRICIEYLRSLTACGKTVVCTIHQPSATVLQHFHHLYILADGQCLYQGRSDYMLTVLAENNMICPCHYNPADFIIEIASGEYDHHAANIKAKLIDRFRSVRRNNEITGDAVAKKNGSHAASSRRQLATLLRREYLKATRNPTLTYLRLLTSVTNSLVLCAIFWQVGNDGGKVLFNYNALLGFVLHLMMPSLMLTILTFPTECAVLESEASNRWYSLKWYYLAVTLIDLPISIIYCLISNAIFYTLTAQPWEVWRFATFSLLGFMICVIAQSVGLLVGAVCNVVNGTFVGSAVSFPMMLFAGFGIRFKDIPPYIQWLGHFSYLKYGVEGMAASVMGYHRKALPCPGSAARHCQYTDAQQFLNEIGAQSDNIELDLVVLAFIFVLVRIASYMCLRKRVFRRK